MKVNKRQLGRELEALALQDVSADLPPGDRAFVAAHVLSMGRVVLETLINYGEDMQVFIRTEYTAQKPKEWVAKGLINGLREKLSKKAEEAPPPELPSPRPGIVRRFFLRVRAAFRRDAHASREYDTP